MRKHCDTDTVGKCVTSVIPSLWEGKHNRQNVSFLRCTPQVAHQPRSKSGPNSFPGHTNTQEFPTPPANHAAFCTVPGQLQALQAGHFGSGARAAEGRRGGEQGHPKASAGRWESSVGDTWSVGCTPSIALHSRDQTGNQWVMVALPFPKQERL